MRKGCDKPDCHIIYDDAVCSTVCPHKGLTHCVACDMPRGACLCSPLTTNPRSDKYKVKIQDVTEEMQRASDRYDAAKITGVAGAETIEELESFKKPVIRETVEQVTIGKETEAKFEGAEPVALTGKIIPPSSFRRVSTFRHESLVGRIVYVDIDGASTGDYGAFETFVKVDGLWYPERSIKAAAQGYRPEQLEVSVEYKITHGSLPDDQEGGRLSAPTPNVDYDTDAINKV